MTDRELPVLIALRLRSRGDETAVAATVHDLLGEASSQSQLDGLLDQLIVSGLVRCRGEERRLSLTAAGESRLTELMVADVAAADRSAVNEAYDAFLPVNRDFLAACVGWQDNPVALEELAELVEALDPILVQLCGAFDRFGSYQARFAAALHEAVSDPRWVDSPRFDSIHTVWFELHEHLLATLGRTRADER